MAIILEVRAGPSAGQTIPLATRRSVVIGRAEGRAGFAVPDDKQMSGVHFAVESGTSGCRLVDQGSTNGTFLNGARIREAMVLANGDEIKAGVTTFVVRIVPDHQPPAVPLPQEAGTPASSAKGQERPMQVPTPVLPVQGPSASAPKQPAPGLVQPSVSAGKQPTSGVAPTVRPVHPPALAIGSWAFHKIPERWQIQEGSGIQQVVKDAFPASVVVMEEALGAGTTLAKYVEAHCKMLRENLPEPKIDSVAAPAVAGSAETAALEVRFTMKDGPAVFFHRVYASSGAAVGVLHLTSLEKDLGSLRPFFNSLLSSVSFSPNG
jgi:pSer/pThr/pTyr-binding forkhead associated (FHA) protein